VKKKSQTYSSKIMRSWLTWRRKCD